MTQKIELRREPGDDLPGEISDLIERGIYNNLLELVANSIDTHHEKIAALGSGDYKPTISINITDDSIVLADNGLGMSADEVRSNFYRLGDSSKKKKKRDKDAPPLIGEFGVGTLVLRALCESYELTSRTIDKEVFVPEYFSPDEVLSFSKKLELTQRDNDSGKTGTAIYMRNIKAAADFNVNTLIKEIQWKFLPLLDVFDIKVNGSKVTSQIISGEEFTLDGHGEHMGHVHGTIYLLNKYHNMSGIHVFVNGRSVGNPATVVPSGRLKAGLINKVVGVMYADGLRDAILFDRGRFKPHHPAFLEFKKYMSSQMGTVLKAYNQSSLEKRVISLHKRKPKLMRRVAGRMKRDEEFRYFRFEEDDFPSHVPGVVVGKTIKINSNYPRLKVTNRSNSAEMQEAYRHTLAEILALETLRSDGIDAYLEKKAEILELFSENTTISKRIYDTMVYTQGAIADHLGLRRGGVSYLIKKGLINTREDEKILGKDVLTVEPLIRGGITLADFVTENLESQLTPNYESRYKKIFDEIGDELSPFIRNVSDNGDGCYILEKVCASGLARLFRSDEFDLRKTDSKDHFVPAYHKFKTQYLSIPELVDTSDDLSFKDVTAAIDFAQKRNMPLNDRLDGTVIKFRYDGFIDALQQIRAR